MRFMLRSMLATTALVLPTMAFAADTPAAPAAGTAAAIGGDAGKQPDATATDESDTANDIVVYGRGSSRQLTEIGATKLQEFVPGSSPLKALQELPGVNFNSADGLGGYEYGVRISIRGFNQGQLGYTLDGIPLGDLAYGNYNGLTVSRAIINENLGTIRVSQGAGSLGTPSTNNLGGTIEFSSNQPADKLGAIGALSGGSNSFFRGYARIDTGELFGIGTKAAITYVHQDADKYKGSGIRRTNQFNFKVVQPLGAATLTAFVNISDRREQDDQDLSFDLIARRGLSTDYFLPDFRSAVLAAQIGANRGDTGQPVTNAAAGTSYAALPYANVTTVDDLYYAGSGLRQDQLTGATLTVPVGQLFDFTATGYYHHNRGQGDFYTPYLATPGGAPLSLRTTEYSIYRKGGIANFNLHLGTHEINGGVWYERNDFGQARRFYGLANNVNAPSLSPTVFLAANTAFFTQWQYQFTTDTVQTHIQDSWQITSDLNVNAGFKSVFVKDNVNTVVAAFASQLINGGFRSDNAFLPQAGVLYKGIDHLELFGNFAKNFRPFGAAITALSPFAAQSQAAIDLTRAGGIKPETSYTYELGSRFQFPRLSGVVSAYYIDFRDRLGVLPQGAQIQGIPGVVANLGGVRSVGVEVAATYKLLDNVRLTGTYSYNDSRFRSDVPGANGTVLVATRNKIVPDAPQHLLKGDINISQGGFYGTLTGIFQSKRYVTLENDRSVPDRFLADLSAGYSFSGNRLLNGLSLELNVTNLFDKKYIAVINSGGTVARGDNQTLLSGAPRQVYVTLRKKI